MLYLKNMLKSWYFYLIFRTRLIRRCDGLLFTVNLADCSTWLVAVIARHVNSPESSMYVDFISKLAVLSLNVIYIIKYIR